MPCELVFPQSNVSTDSISAAEHNVAKSSTSLDTRSLDGNPSGGPSMVAMPWNDTGSMITHFEDLIKRVYVSPDLPQGPTFHNFPYSPTSNPNELNAIKTAFLNAFELALAGLRVATTPCQGDEDMPSAYTRYFNAGEDVRQTVVNVLMGMLGPGNMGPDMMHDAQWPLEVW